MRLLTRAMCKASRPTDPPVFNLHPLQLGMGKDPWKVAVSSMLLCKTKRTMVDGVLARLLAHCPDASSMARAELADIEGIVWQLGFQRQRSRRLLRFSAQWLSDHWVCMQDLPGVGIYVADAVGLFCFGFTDLESHDHALEKYRYALLDGGVLPMPSVPSCR